MKKFILLTLLIVLFNLSGCFFNKKVEPEEEYITIIKLSKNGEMFFVEEQDNAMYLRVPTSYAKLNVREEDSLVEFLFGINAISPSYDSDFLIYTDFYLGTRKMFYEPKITVISGQLDNIYNVKQEIVIRSATKGNEEIFVNQKFIIEFYDDVPVDLTEVTLDYSKNNDRYDLEYQEIDDDYYYVNGEKMKEDIYNKMIKENIDEITLNFYSDNTYDDEISADEALELSRNNIRYESPTIERLGRAYGFVYFTITDAGNNVTKSIASVYLYDNVAPYIMKNGYVCKDNIVLNIGVFPFKHPQELKSFVQSWLNKEGYIVRDNVNGSYVNDNLIANYNKEGQLYIGISDGNNYVEYIDNTSMCDMKDDINSGDSIIDFAFNNYLFSYNVSSKTNKTVTLRKIINNTNDYIILKNTVNGWPEQISEIKLKYYLKEDPTTYYYNSLSNKYIALVSNDPYFWCNDKTVLMENDNYIKVFIDNNIHMTIYSIMNTSETNQMDIYLECSEVEYYEKLGVDGKQFYSGQDGKWLYGDEDNYILHFDYTLELFEQENTLNGN